MRFQLGVVTVSASRDLFQVPLKPGFLAAPSSVGRPEALPRVYEVDSAYASVYQTPSTDALLVQGQPYSEYDSTQSSSSESESSNLLDFLTTGSIVSMFAVIGYAVGRKSSQNVDIVPQRELELEPSALELAGPAVATLGVMGRTRSPHRCGSRKRCRGRTGRSRWRARTSSATRASIRSGSLARTRCSWAGARSSTARRS